MANESPTSPQLSHGSCRSSEGRMTACPPDQRRPLRRVFDEEVSLAQHVGHDTAVDDRLSWRAADTGAALERPATQKRYMPIHDCQPAISIKKERTVKRKKEYLVLFANGETAWCDFVTPTLLEYYRFEQQAKRDRRKKKQKKRIG